MSMIDIQRLFIVVVGFFFLLFIFIFIVQLNHQPKGEGNMDIEFELEPWSYERVRRSPVGTVYIVLGLKCIKRICFPTLTCGFKT